MDHKSVAQRVLKDVGGAGNIVAAAHCATRLRLVLKNQDKVDQAAIDNDEDLQGQLPQRWPVPDHRRPRRRQRGA